MLCDGRATPKTYFPKEAAICDKRCASNPTAAAAAWGADTTTIGVACAASQPGKNVGADCTCVDSKAACEANADATVKGYWINTQTPTWNTPTTYDRQCCGDDPSDYGIVTFCGAQNQDIMSPNYMDGTGYNCKGEWLCFNNNTNKDGNIDADRAKWLQPSWARGKPLNPVLSAAGTPDNTGIIVSVPISGSEYDFVSTGHYWVKCTGQAPPAGYNQYSLYQLDAKGGLYVPEGGIVHAGLHDYACIAEPEGNYAFYECCGDRANCQSVMSPIEAITTRVWTGGKRLPPADGTIQQLPLADGASYICGPDGLFIPGDVFVKQSPGTCSTGKCASNQCYASQGVTGGFNLIPNGDMELGGNPPTGWGGAATITTVQDDRGKVAKVVPGTTPAAIKAGSITYTYLGGSVSSPIRVQKGAAYSGSVYVKSSSSAKVKYLVNIQQYNNHPGLPGTKVVAAQNWWGKDVFVSSDINAADGWTKIDINSFTPDTNAAFITLRINPAYVATTPNIQFTTYYVDDFKLVSDSGCVDAGTWSGDYYCKSDGTNADWVTRTKLLAQDMLTLIPAGRENYFTLSCDSAERALNEFAYINEFTGPDGQPKNYLQLMNNFCVLKINLSGGTVFTAAGVSLNFEPNGLDVNNIFGISCSNVGLPLAVQDVYRPCNINDASSKLWYNLKKNSYIFSTTAFPQPVASTNPAKGSLIDRFVNAIKMLFKNIVGLLTGARQPVGDKYKYTATDLSDAGSRFYLYRNGATGASVSARLEAKCSGTTKMNAVAVNYSGVTLGVNGKDSQFFSDTFEAACGSYDSGRLKCYAQNPADALEWKGVMVISDAADTGPLDMVWNSLTAKLRFGVPCWQSEVSKTVRGWTVGNNGVFQDTCNPDDNDYKWYYECVGGLSPNGNVGTAPINLKCDAGAKCANGVCLTQVCGDGSVEPNEVCDVAYDCTSKGGSTPAGCNKMCMKDTGGNYLTNGRTLACRPDCTGYYTEGRPSLYGGHNDALIDRGWCKESCGGDPNQKDAGGVDTVEVVGAQCYSSSPPPKQLQEDCICRVNT